MYKLESAGANNPHALWTEAFENIINRPTCRATPFVRLQKIERKVVPVVQ